MTIVEINNQLVEKAQNGIKNSLSRVAKKQFKDDGDQQGQFVADVLKRLNGSSDLAGVVKETDIVIEAIVENIAIKHKLFESIDKVIFYFFSITSSLDWYATKTFIHIGCTKSYDIHLEYIIIVDHWHRVGYQSQRPIWWIAFLQPSSSDAATWNHSH